jgi:hypothetical protein
MPQQTTDTDTLSLLVLAGPDVYARLHAPAPAETWDAAQVWDALDRHRSPVRVSIEYRPTPAGAEDVTVYAVTDGLGVRWKLRLVTGGTGDPFAVDSVEVHSRDGQPVGRRLLARLGLGRVHRALDRARSDPAAAAVLGERWGAVVAPKPGRRGRPDLHYARAALDYVEALEAAPRAPVRYLIEQAGGHMTADEIKARVRRARERGLLTKATKGRAGGRLTSKARKLLREAGLIEEDSDGER